MDFIDRLKDSINDIPNLPIKCRKGYLGLDESCALYALPGGSIKQAFMDGIKDEQLNYELAIKTKDGNKAEQTLWLISDHLEQLNSLWSQDGSFEFQGVNVASKPFINDADEQGWFVFLLNFSAEITTFP